jgi:hypothetical protein
MTSESDSKSIEACRQGRAVDPATSAKGSGYRRSEQSAGGRSRRGLRRRMRQGLRRWLQRWFRLRWLRWVWMCRMRPGLVGSLRRRVCCRSRLLHILGGMPLLLALPRKVFTEGYRHSYGHENYESGEGVQWLIAKPALRPRLPGDRTPVPCTPNGAGSGFNL